jgi:hypothetical protein
MAGGEPIAHMVMSGIAITAVIGADRQLATIASIT